MPPSPVVRSLRGWNENAASSAPAPTGRRRYVDPAAQAASSITAMLERIAQGAHRIQVGGHSRLIDQDHGAGPAGQMRLHGLWHEVLRGQVHIGEDWLRTDVTHRIGRGNERKRRDNDLVSRPYPGGDQRQVKRGRARGHGHRVRERRWPQRMPPRTPGPVAPARSSQMPRPRRPPRPPPCRATASSQGSSAACLVSRNPLSAPPGDQPPQAFLQVNFRFPAQTLAGAGNVRQAAGDRVDAAGWPEFQRPDRAHGPLECLGEFHQAGLGAAARY